MTTTTFGVHVGLQHTTPDELLPLYRHIEALGFGWISVWDHFYGATGADGWNAPFVAPEQFAAKRDILHRHCADVGRDPLDIRCAVNVGLAWTEDSLRSQFGGLRDYVRPGVLSGSVGEVVDRVGTYVEAGVDQVNLALRAPFDVDALERFATALELA